MLFDDSYLTIEHPATGIFKDRGSRFIGLAFPVKEEQKVKEIINSIRSEHPKANHHCYAFRLGPGKNLYRFSDDREPSGTAGKPIYGIIKSNDLTDILIVVVRYFGGTLLGVPGLIHAYRAAAQAAVAEARIVSKIITEKYRISFEYESISLVMELIKQADATIINQQLELSCSITVELPKSSADTFLSKIKNHYLLKEKCDITVV